MVMKNFTERIGADAMEARLDAALADTFPASDPVSITVREPPQGHTASADAPAAGGRR
ncbi:hypothetical protein [Teichococcus oryzae]|uniref:hypothetical protein n=1 Tax=Teichococcus oryzae TaxID=1608942 RepID=UPI0013757D16|nr:hypothetical protein [Pseudoroseomonas oryzae]